MLHVTTVLHSLLLYNNDHRYVVFKNELRLNIKPLTRGYNTVADRWPGATTPPYAQPHMATHTLFLHAHFF